MSEDGERRQLKASIRQTRDRTARVKVPYEKGRVSEEKPPWPVYVTDATVYVTDFSAKFPQIATLSQRFAERHKRGEKVLVVDICGVADAHSLGADHTVGFTLNRPPEMTDTDTLTIVEGDIFTTRDQNKLLRTIGEGGVPISCVFFRPVAGLDDYGERPETVEKLYVLLKRIFDRLADDGEIYISSREFPTGIEILDRILPKYGVEKKYVFEHKPGWRFNENFAPSLYIKKIAGSHLPEKLPLSEKDRADLHEAFTKSRQRWHYKEFWPKPEGKDR